MNANIEKNADLRKADLRKADLKWVMSRRHIIMCAGAVLLVGCAGSEKRESTGELIDDSVITTKVKAAFVESPEISVFDVGVTTFRGTVQLSGFVDTEEQRVIAEKIASDIAGVAVVENKISVK